MAADIPEELLQRLRRATWHATTHVQPHEYIVKSEDPALYEEMRVVIAQQGYVREFQGWTYRYVDLDGYKYWSLPPVLNREPLPPADVPLDAK
jgi:hypothetical protein